MQLQPVSMVQDSRHQVLKLKPAQPRVCEHQPLPDSSSSCLADTNAARSQPVHRTSCTRHALSSRAGRHKANGERMVGVNDWTGCLAVSSVTPLYEQSDL